MAPLALAPAGARRYECHLPCCVEQEFEVYASVSLRSRLLTRVREASDEYLLVQDDALYADMWTFVFWQAGRSGWQTRFPGQ